jgi:2-dehydropantoate 2-reductase
MLITMRFVIYGAGAVGGVTGALLARAGREVVLIARGEHHDAIARDGLRVETPDETFTVRVPVVAHPSQIAWRDDDVVLLAVKTQDIAPCVRELAAVAPEVATVCLTNGVEAERIAARHLANVHGGCVFMPVTHMVAGVVQVWSWPLAGAIDVGRYPRGESICLAALGLASQTTDDIMRFKRGKLLTNLANAAEALCGPAARRSPIAERARAEGIACFDAAGLSRTTDAEDAARRAGIQSRPIAGAPRAGGSTWQSLARGHALEVDYLNGEIALLGRLHGVPTPINAALQRLANSAARAGARPGALALADLEAQLLRG